MTMELQLRTDYRRGEVPVLVVIGEVDMTNVDSFRRALTDAAAERTELVVDLAGVRYLDSTGVAALFLQARRVRLEVIASDMIAPVLEISGFEQVATVRSGSDLASQ